MKLRFSPRQMIVVGAENGWALRDFREDDGPVRAGDLHVERVDGRGALAVWRDGVIDALALGVDERRGERAGDALHEIAEDDAEGALFLIARARVRRHHGAVALAISASDAGSMTTGWRFFAAASSAA